MVWQWRGSLASSFLSVFLSWSTNTTSVAGKVHQHPFYLRKLNKSNLTQKLLVNFYHGTIGSMLIYCLSVWFASCMKAGNESEGKAGNIIGHKLPDITIVYTSRCICRSNSIIRGQSHPTQHFLLQFFTPKQSGI